jgi:hypothetical protein
LPPTKPTRLAHCPITPAAPQETLSTLSFLRRAKCVRNHAVVRVDVVGDNDALSKEVARWGAQN